VISIGRETYVGFATTMFWGAAGGGPCALTSDATVKKAAAERKWFRIGSS
jgi:hypothetical protein